MQKFSQIQARIYVLDKLINGRYFGKHQMASENIIKGKSRSDAKLIKKALKHLIKKGFILTKKKHYDVHISLDPHMTDLIKDYLHKLENRRRAK